MAPNLTTTTALFLTDDVFKTNEPSTSGTRSRGTEKKAEEQLEQEQELELEKKEEKPQYEWNIRWRNVIAFIYLHSFAAYGIYLSFTVANWKTIVWAVWLAVFSAVGVTGGAHRLWCHRAYKAKWPLRLLLCVLQTAAFQNHIYEWVRDHRVHHKFTDTDADPHNSQRGFFFCHIGWLMIRKHPDVKTKGKTVDMSDLLEDPIVLWQKRTYLVTMPILCFILPAWLPVHFWNEDPWVSWYVASIMRYTLSLNFTWLVNSAAHMWGTKPYDKNITAVENTFVGIFGMGEGWHNYHHTFPWDYKAAELGKYAANLTTGVIDFFSLFGWAYDLKTASDEMIIKRSARTGDGSYKGGSSTDFTDSAHDHHHNNGNPVWGWGDKDMTEEDVKAANIYNKSD